MKVEIYSKEYFNDILSLVEIFYDEYLKDLYKSFNLETVKDSVSKATENESNAFLLLDGNKCVGALIGVETISKVNDRRFFQEIFWYIKKPYGRYMAYMIKQVENKLKQFGYNDIVMAVMVGKKYRVIENIYSKIGYEPIETHWIKAL